jgi:hypothetical protein
MGMSMMGSGIYSKDVVIDFVCGNEDCGHEEELDYATDDWGYVGDVDCPKCGQSTNCDPEEIEEEYSKEKEMGW